VCCPQVGAACVGGPGVFSRVICTGSGEVANLLPREQQQEFPAYEALTMRLTRNLKGDSRLPNTNSASAPVKNTGPERPAGPPICCTPTQDPRVLPRSTLLVRLNSCKADHPGSKAARAVLNCQARSHCRTASLSHTELLGSQDSNQSPVVTMKCL